MLDGAVLSRSVEKTRQFHPQSGRSDYKGYHAYRVKPEYGENPQLCRELDNTHDLNAITIQRGPVILGRVPWLYSGVFTELMETGTTIKWFVFCIYVSSQIAQFCKFLCLKVQLNDNRMRMPNSEGLYISHTDTAGKTPKNQNEVSQGISCSAKEGNKVKK